MKRHKWLAVVLAAVMVLGMMPAMAAANGEPVSDCQILYAGQNIPVGTVCVENDEDEIWVTYKLDQDKIDDGWVFTELHLAIAEDFAGLPKNSTGNPVPGHFQHKEYFDITDGRTEWTFKMDLADIGEDDVEAGATVFIAAHAVVEMKECVTESGSFEPDLTWKRSTERTTEENPVANFPGYGGNWTLDDAFAIELDDAQPVWDSGTYQYKPGITATEWASWKYASNWSGSDPMVDGGGYALKSDLRRFNATFEIPAGYEVVSGTITTVDDFDGIPINDNVYIFMNEELLFWGGTRVITIGGTFMTMPGVQALRGDPEPKETDRWYIPGTLPAITDFVEGTNALDVFTEENERWGGMGALKLTLDYEVTTCTYYKETAWAAGTRFVNRGNWATYFCYNIKGWVEPETVTVDSAIMAGAYSGSLASGTQYKFVVTGTWNNRNPETVDAQYVSPDTTWTTWTDGPAGGYDIRLLDLQVNNAFVDWGPYNAGHEYELLFVGTGSTVNFRVFDGDAATNTPNPGWYGDNQGLLTVTIYVWK